MLFSQTLEQIEQLEEELRAKVSALPAEQRKEYFQLQAKNIKDPDTYASLNYLFLGGIHHLYLKKYHLFAIEISLLTIAIIGLFNDYPQLCWLVVAVALYELPQLFYSQRIARLHNYHTSVAIFEQVTFSSPFE